MNDMDLSVLPVDSIKAALHKIDVLSWMYEHWTVRGNGPKGRVPFNLDGHWFQEELITHKHPESYTMKAAQMGISEIELAHSVHFAEYFGNVIYLFPTSTHIGEFSQARFQPVIDSSKHLQKLISDKTPARLSEDYEEETANKKKMVDRVSLKAVGNHFFYLRGSQTGAQLKSVDGDKLVIDEYDEMKQNNVPLAKARIDHSLYKIIHGMSTPTIPEFGIHAEYIKGDQRRYFIRCRHCNELQYLTWQDNVVPEISTEFRLCRKCRKPLNYTQRGEWVPTYRDRSVRSYHISQLYSSRVPTAYLIEFSKDPKNEQELYNSKLGEPYTPEGGQLSRDVVLARIGGYEIPKSSYQTTMGVDIGPRDIYYVISRFRGGHKNILKANTVRNFEDLDFLMDTFGVCFSVIDAQPESRKAREFANRFRGRVWLAYYTRMKGYWKEATNENNDLLVHIERTTSLDYSLGRFRNGTVSIPGKRANEGAYTYLPDDGYNSFVDQLCAPIRLIQKDPSGNAVATYVEGSKADHYAHANNYDDIAIEMMQGKTYGEVGASIL